VLIPAEELELLLLESCPYLAVMLYRWKTQDSKHTNGGKYSSLASFSHLAKIIQISWE
jgi:hypothetical protein